MVDFHNLIEIILSTCFLFDSPVKMFKGQNPHPRSTNTNKKSMCKMKGTRYEVPLFNKNEIIEYALLVYPIKMV